MNENSRYRFNVFSRLRQKSNSPYGFSPAIEFIVAHVPDDNAHLGYFQGLEESWSYPLPVVVESSLVGRTSHDSFIRADIALSRD